MNKSESIKELATALSKFQGEVKNPANTANNPFFKSKYAPLNDVLNLVRPILSKNGLSVVQAPSGDGENIIVTTTLLHESGEYIEFTPLVLKADKPTAQGAGSAITYARRYALSAILGISSEDDDDGNGAEPGKDKLDDKKDDKKDDKNAKPLSEAQIKRLYAIGKTAGYDENTVRGHVKVRFNKNLEDMTKAEYDAVCKGYEGLKK
jgi:hypothetical protein